MKTWILVATLAICGCVKNVETSPKERTVLFLAKRIVTMDPKKPTAEAIAWRDGKIVAVGSRAEVYEAVGSNATVEDFGDAVIIPGLIDAHGHVEGLGRALSIVSLEGAKSLEEAASRMKNPPTAARQAEWFLGRGWDQNDWVGKEFPTHDALDAIDATHPMWLTRVDGHAGWANAAALKIAGITKATKDPAGGRIVRDAKGEPTGVLVDNAMDLVTGHIPAPTDEQRQRWLKIAVETCARLGLTQVHDAGISIEAFQVLQAWDLLGVLPVRIYAMADGQGDQADAFLGNGVFSGHRLELKAVKLLLDGALGSRGAALEAPYADEPLHKGLLLLEPSEFTHRAKSFDARGFQVAVHAIGDRANDIALDVLSELNLEQRPRVEHAQVLKPDDITRFFRTGIIASFQPTHATSDMPWAEARLGADRVTRAYAWKSVLDTGAHVAFGSDFPVENPNPLLGIYAARTRQDPQGWPPEGWHPEQRVTGQQALAGFTTGAAYAAFAEEKRGQLKVGFDADLVVLPIDPSTAEPKSLLDAKVMVTVVDGVDVYRAQK